MGVANLWQVCRLVVFTQQSFKKTQFGKGKKPIGMSDETWEKLDEKALFAIQMCLTNEVLQEALNQNKASGLWTKLEYFF